MSAGHLAPLDSAAVAAFLEPRHHELAAALEGFVAAEIAPLARPAGDDEARRQAREILERLGTGGWLRWAVPEEHGGHPGAPDLRACCLIREALAGASPLADAVFALQCLGSMPLTLAGSAGQRERWLPAVAEGRAMAAFAMTEGGAGSDVAAIATRAVTAPEGYRLDGAKSLISNAGIADYYVVFAGTGAPGDRRGLSALVVPADTPGLRMSAPQVLSAPHPLGELAFEGCRLPSEALLGDEGGGFALGMRTLDRLRPTVGAAACGMAARALAEALAHARQRQQFGKALADFQLVQAKLAAMAIELAAARLLTYRAAWEADRGAQRVTLPAAMAKAFATEAAQRVVDQAVQIVGGRGALADHPVDHLYRAVRSLRIYEGTTEIQHLVVARELLQG
jgi:acyl-CoA dehydrogenase